MEKTERKLPEITQQSILHVDGTPNDGYVLRILQAYRENCNCKWSDTTDGQKTENPLLVLMNEQQDQRAKLLDEAINKLASQPPCVLMPGEEDLKQYITNLLYKARDNGADVLNETSFDSWQEEQESRFCQRKR